MTVNRFWNFETYLDVPPEQEEMYHIRSRKRRKTFDLTNCALFTKTRNCGLKILATITLTFPTLHTNILLYKGQWLLIHSFLMMWSSSANINTVYNLTKMRILFQICPEGAAHSCNWQVGLLIYGGQNDIGGGAANRGGVRSRANVKLISFNNIIVKGF